MTALFQNTDNQKKNLTIYAFGDLDAAMVIRQEAEKAGRNPSIRSFIICEGGGVYNNYPVSGDGRILGFPEIWDCDVVVVVGVNTPPPLVIAAAFVARQEEKPLVFVPAYGKPPIVMNLDLPIENSLRSSNKDQYRRDPNIFRIYG